MFNKKGVFLENGEIEDLRPLNLQRHLESKTFFKYEEEVSSVVKIKLIDKIK